MLKHSIKILLCFSLILTSCGVSAEDRLISYIADSTCHVQELVNEVGKVQSGEAMSDEQMMTLTQKRNEMKDELEKKRRTYFATQAEVTRVFNGVKDQHAFFENVKTSIQGKCTADEKTIQDIISRLKS